LWYTYSVSTFSVLFRFQCRWSRILVKRREREREGKEERKGGRERRRKEGRGRREGRDAVIFFRIELISFRRINIFITGSHTLTTPLENFKSYLIFQRFYNFLEKCH
jgi:hypothetical protein